MARPIRVEVPRTYTYSPAWVTHALSGAFPGSVVGQVDTDPIDAGTTHRIRLRLRYDKGRGPERLFIKTQGRPGHRLLLASMQIVTPEARVLGSGVPLPYEHPVVYAAGVDAIRLNSIIVMEDVTSRGATTNIVTRPITLEDVKRGISELAKLHASYWDRIPVELDWIRPFSVNLGFVALAMISSLKGPPRLEEIGALDVLPADLRGWDRSLWLLRGAAVQQMRGPITLLHGDTHVGNTYRLPDGTMGFVDLQVVHRGTWSRDIGYFLISALEVEDRRKHEQALLRHYMDALAHAGVRVPSWDAMWESYRSTPMWGIVAWLSTIGAMDYQKDVICLRYLERFGAAYRDFDTAGLLKA